MMSWLLPVKYFPRQNIFCYGPRPEGEILGKFWLKFKIESSQNSSSEGGEQHEILNNSILAPLFSLAEIIKFNQLVILDLMNTWECKPCKIFAKNCFAKISNYLLACACKVFKVFCYNKDHHLSAPGYFNLIIFKQKVHWTSMQRK